MHFGLFLDSSQKDPFGILIKGDKVFGSFFFSEGKSSSKLIFELKNFLDSHQCSLSELDYICVGTGPGSFIGTRVAVITSKALCYALKKPLLHLCSLCGYKPKSEGKFAILSDAKSKGYYLLEGHQELSKIYYNPAPIIADPSLILENYHLHALYTGDIEFLKGTKNLLQEKVSILPVDLDHLALKSFSLYQLFLEDSSTATDPEIFYLRVT